MSSPTTAPASAPPVPFVGLRRQHDELRDELAAAFARVLDADAFILGAEVDAFEREFAAYCEADHCIGVASGTAALTLALLAAGVGEGDEVIVPGHTFVASALGVLHAGATPVFCDVLDGSGLIDPEAVRAAISAHTAAIIGVHLYGQSCDMRALGGLADRAGLFLLEDAAQAHGARFGGRRTGSLGTAAAFSFYPSKNLGALGDGGAICTNDAELARRARALRHLGQIRRGEHALLGFNERLDGLQAAFLRTKLPHLDGWNAARRAHARRYAQNGVGAHARLLDEGDESPSVFHLFPIRLENRDEAIVRLWTAGVATGVHYAPAAHRHEAIRSAVRVPPAGALPNAEAWAREELSLPMFAELTGPEVDRVSGALALS
jgi:dTDP-3-amino-3,4,6-trideoxy-alpha-D-glucose transaminase